VLLAAAGDHLNIISGMARDQLAVFVQGTQGAGQPHPDQVDAVESGRVEPVDQYVVAHQCRIADVVAPRADSIRAQQRLIDQSRRVDDQQMAGSGR